MDWLRLFLLIAIAGPLLTSGSMINRRPLRVGEELFKETLPFQIGSCIYHLQGLKPNTWYEVKISYPASIPSRFSLQLNKVTSDMGMNLARKLLNTEKLIFKTDATLSMADESGLSVTVAVEPEGIVAIPGARERDFVIFNIVCDELLLGIPQSCWYVVAAALFCLILAFVLPFFLPDFLLPRNGNPPPADHPVSKKF